MLPEAPAEKREAAIQLGSAVPVYEPRILERLVALTYLAVGGEHLWIARAYSSLFWVLTGIGLYALAVSGGSALGGLVAVGWFLFLPYGLVASRSFQPDPLMVMLIVFGLLSLARWRSTRASTVGVGLVLGAAILVKAVALFPVIGAFVGVVLERNGLRRVFRDAHVWIVAVLMMLPATIYYVILASGRSSGLFTFWVLRLRELLAEPTFYLQWARQAENVTGSGWLVLGLAGALVLPRRAVRPAVVGAWVGYGIYGLALPYQIMTHDYYHLMLVPLVALGLAPVASAAFSRLETDRGPWKVAAAGVAALAVAMFAWRGVGSLAEVDYRPEAAGWRRMGEQLPRDGEIVALTHAYGARLQYYGWLNTRPWPYVDDIALESLAGKSSGSFEEEFALRTAGARYFLVTRFDELERQGDLRDYLYGHFPVYAEGDGYILFDLRGG